MNFKYYVGGGSSNNPPLADSGPDQIEHALIDGIAEVALDGSGSSDFDGDDLTYTWYLRGQVVATGVNPTIELQVGVHIIELLVNDWTVDSEPDEVVITVIEASEAQLCIFPSLLNRNRGDWQITALLRLPGGITRDEVDLDQALLLYPGGIDATRQCAIQSRGRGSRRTSIFAFFNKDDLMDAVPNDGQVELQVAGQLKNGRYVYGSDMVRIVSCRRWIPWWQAWDN